MSAFLVSDEHIDTLLSFAIRPEYQAASYYWWDRESHYFNRTSEVGQVLVNENYRSLAARYDDKDEPHTYKFTHRHYRLDPVQIIKLCDCYDYQACETDDYNQTEAHSIVACIRHRAISELPGYDAAEWTL